MDNPPASSPPRVGYWFSAKKSRKFDLELFRETCARAGIELVKIDLSQPIEEQGPFAAILHKMTEVIAQADQGELESKRIVQCFERFIRANPRIRIIDPFDNLRHLLDRYLTYSTISNSDLHQAGEVFVPPFVDLISSDVQDNVKKLREAGVHYPFVCKPSVAHGSKMAHQMSIVFHEGAVGDCEPPCVAMTFIPHDAVLFKIFVIGQKYFVVERPSLKNFEAAERETIFFDSHDVSKPDSVSHLSVLDEETLEEELDEGQGNESIRVRPTVSGPLIDRVVAMLRHTLQMSLFGVDIVVEKGTGRYAIIDINAFPGYEGVPDFFSHVTQLLIEMVGPITNIPMNTKKSCTTVPEEDSGIDTGDSSDEKKRVSRITGITKRSPS